jgi:hypothetical protein
MTTCRFPCPQTMQSLMCKAARQGDLAEVQELYENDHRLVNARDSCGRTALMEVGYCR